MCNLGANCVLRGIACASSVDLAVQTPGIDGFIPSYSSTKLAMRASDWPLAANFSEATLHYEMQPSSYQLIGSTFATDQQCDTGSAIGATTAIQFKDMQGLFLISAIVVVVSLLVAFCQHCRVDKVVVDNLNSKSNHGFKACPLEQSSPHTVWEIKGGEVVCNAVDINTPLELGMVGNTSRQATIMSEIEPDAIERQPGCIETLNVTEPALPRASG